MKKPATADARGEATDIARNMVTRFGMYEKLGQMTYEEPRQSFLGENMLGSTPRNCSEETAREIDCAVLELTTAARQRALEILTTNRFQLEQGAALLLASEIPRPSPIVEDPQVQQTDAEKA